jgi:hypothetical protein
MCSSFKSELLGGVHDLDTDVIKIALFTSSATLSAATTAYATTNEVVGTAYVAGGNTLTSPVISLAGTTAICDFADSTWAASTITARGALIYNSSKANRAIAVLDFGSDKTSTAGDFTVVMPAAAAATALIRLA